jgi:hypothetical protein
MATAMVSLTVSPQRVLGPPQTIQLAVIFGAVAGISAVVVFSAALALRRKRKRRALSIA